MESDETERTGRINKIKLNEAWQEYRKEKGGRTSLQAKAERAAFYAGAATMIAAFGHGLRDMGEQLLEAIPDMDKPE